MSDLKCKRVIAGSYEVWLDGKHIGGVSREGFGDGWNDEWVFTARNEHTIRQPSLRRMKDYLTEILVDPIKEKPDEVKDFPRVQAQK